MVEKYRFKTLQELFDTGWYKDDNSMRFKTHYFPAFSQPKGQALLGQTVPDEFSKELFESEYDFFTVHYNKSYDSYILEQIKGLYVTKEMFVLNDNGMYELW